MSELRQLVLVAGEGDLPVEIVNACQKKHIDVLIIRASGEKQFKLPAAHHVVTLANLGETIQQVKAAGFLNLVFAGKIDHNLLFENYGAMRLQNDLTARGDSASLGDNSYFAGLVRFLEAQGFHVVGVQDILAEAMTPMGILTTAQPTLKCLEDAKLGVSIAKKIGEMDIGQALVIENRYVLGVEAVEGTDNLIKRCREFKSPHKEGVLVKVKKAMQDTRIDLPVIGETTVRHVVEANLAGIALEAGWSILINKEETLKLANQAGIFIMGL
ncbi:LpxI family protein [Legionella sp. MW5194]|uniref:LpxI family protein n=1 Tax=Legionella sp. MW5194 TaxID=2662448 RepID=UPI00193D5F12|nr:UDP-2,3-diacylglucosamine diphosphatase LpxI [Legionella sp. MW5194]